MPMQVFRSLCVLSLVANQAWGSSPLPQWLDLRWEVEDSAPPQFYAPFWEGETALRVPAEYEPVGAVVLGWTGSTKFLGDIARVIAQKTDASLWVASGPAALTGVPAERYFPVACALNTMWVRDYGPVGVLPGTGKVALVDSVYRHYRSRRNDDASPFCLGQKTQTEVFSVNLVLDGGNFLIDSHGNLFMTSRTYVWNSKLSKEEVDTVLKRTYGAQTIHVIDYPGQPGEPADGTGHIDMFVKLLNDETVLISTANQEPFLSAVNKAVAYFEGLQAPTGRPYTILRVPGWYESSTWYTYTNSLIVNGAAMVPSYQYYPAQNEEALRVYEQAGFQTNLINSDRTIGMGGSIHCVTQTIPLAE